MSATKIEELEAALNEAVEKLKDFDPEALNETVEQLQQTLKKIPAIFRG